MIETVILENGFCIAKDCDTGVICVGENKIFALEGIEEIIKANKSCPPTIHSPTPLKLA